MFATIEKLTAEESANAYGKKYVVKKYHRADCAPSYYYFNTLEDAEEYKNRINA